MVASDAWSDTEATGEKRKNPTAALDSAVFIWSSYYGLDYLVVYYLMAFYVLRRGVELSSIIEMAIAYYYGTIWRSNLCITPDSGVLGVQSGVLGVHSEYLESTLEYLESTV
jgi:hypothetical protein